MSEGNQSPTVLRRTLPSKTGHTDDVFVTVGKVRWNADESNVIVPQTSAKKKDDDDDDDDGRGRWK